MSPRVVDGVWGYRSGTGSSTMQVPGRVMGITVYAGSSDGSMAINGGDTVVVPAGTSVSWAPNGKLLSPSIVFSGASTWIVEFLS